MSLSDFSIQRPVFAWMLMSFLIVFGAISFSRMGVSELPDVDFPVLTVSVGLEGASPEVMEMDVVDIIEDSVMSVQGVKTVTSTSRQGTASISIEFDLDRDIDSALQDVQARIVQAQRRLPKDMDPPVIFKANPEDQPIMWLSVESKKQDSRALADFVRNSLKDEFTRLPGVAEVFLGGFVDPNIRVTLDPAKLEQLSLTAKDIITALQNEHTEKPGGQFTEGTKEFSVRTLGEAPSLNDLKKIAINSRGGSPNFSSLMIQDVGHVDRGMNEVRRVSRTNGQTAIGLGIRKQRGSNAVSVGDAVRTKLAELQKRLPEEYSIGVNYDGTAYVKEAVHELNFTLIAAAILTSLVCLLFLGSLAATFNIVLAIPTSIVGTFIVLYFSNFTLNTFTLLGLSISIGIVVDDAIMMLENITRHYEMGKTKIQAAIDGAREISYAALVATVAIIAIFIPVVFMDGIVGKFLYQFGITISVAVALSLVEALTLTPMRCAQFMDSKRDRGKFGTAIDRVFDQWRDSYATIIAWALENRWKVIAGSLLFFVASLATVKFIPKEFAPSQDQSRFLVRVQTPVGSSLEYTDSKFKEIEAFLLKRSEVYRYYAAVGGFGGGEINTGIIFVSMKPKGARGKDPTLGREASQSDFMDICRKHFNSIPDVEARIQDMSARGFSGGGRGFPVEFTIRGPEWSELGRLAEEIQTKINETGLVVDTDTSYQTGTPELQILPDREAAAKRGVSVVTIGETISALTTGVLASRYAEGGRRYDIRVQVDSPPGTTKQAIKNLYVRNNRGELVSLAQVVKFQESKALASITRQDRERSVSVYANVAPGASQATAIERSREIAEGLLPEKYRLVTSGSSQSMMEGFVSLGFALLLGILVSYMVLASQYNSFIHPITVLMALPFSASGAFLALLIFKQSLNLYSFIGLLLLMGIVKKNSILLVDYTNTLRREGLNVREALIKACPIRLRPILMTSFATIAGALPGALALGPGSETRIPMSLAVMGGVAISTLLTLFVVPCVYSLLSRLER